MQLSKYAVILMILFIMITVSILGGYLGYRMDGVDYSGGTAMAKFWLSCITFQIDGMPVYISAMFFVVTAMFGLVVVSLLRGTE